MSRLSEERSIIPKPVWFIAGLLSVALTIVLLRLPLRMTMPFALLFYVGFPVILFVYVALIGYVYADARRRAMRPVMWTLLVIFIPNTIGFILYFILREPVVGQCPHCGAGIKSGFAFCPVCGGALAQTCPECHHPVEPNWSHCARCGAQLPG